MQFRAVLVLIKTDGGGSDGTRFKQTDREANRVYNAGRFRSGENGRLPNAAVWLPLTPSPNRR